MTLQNTYTVGGITYQWQSSTISNVGPFTTIPNATLSSAPVPTLATTTWYQAVITCSATLQTITLTPTQFFVAGSVVNTVPYFENFEGVQMNNRLPNCSWSANGVPNTTQTYSVANTNNRVPRSGSKFASFFNSPAGPKYFWSNGIQMEPGITYSANLWFTTEYFGYNNWTNLTVLVGTSQSATGLTQIADASPAISGPYKALGGIFTVPSSGVYYIAVRAVSANGSALYLSWDDLSVTIPCGPSSPNSPTVSISASSSTICSGDQTNLIANGASSYMWNDGSTGSQIIVSPPATTVYAVYGTNTLTGCTTTVTQMITVEQSPNVFVVTNKPEVCPGETANLTAYGAGQISWSTGGNGNVISVIPNATTTYSAIGTSANGCVGTGTVTVVLKTAPTIVASSGNAADMCAGEILSLSAIGAGNYQWISSSSSVLYSGNPVNFPLFTSSTFTVMGTGANGCSGKATVSQNVSQCLGLTQIQSKLEGLQVYPNPSNGIFNVQLQNGESLFVKVMDVSGRVIISQGDEAGKVTLDLSNMASGIYFAEITSSGSKDTIRIIKN